MSRFTAILRTSARRQTLAPHASRTLFTTPILRASAGYGDPAHEGANNMGTKTPASANNPRPSGSGRKGGATDSERSGGGGSSGDKVKNSGTASEGTPASGGSKRVSVKGNEPAPEAETVMGSEGGGKTGPPSEEKKIGEKPRKTSGEDASQQTQER